MDNKKFLLKSKGVVGSLIVIVGTITQVAQIIGFDLGFLAPELETALLNIITGIGGILALYGRITATTKIKF